MSNILNVDNTTSGLVLHAGCQTAKLCFSTGVLVQFVLMTHKIPALLHIAAGFV
jgi:hypothetical protein